MAGSLAAVTCKEPLRVAIGNHLRALLSAAAPDQPTAAVEQVVQMASADNIDWACAVVEQAAMAKRFVDDVERCLARYALSPELILCVLN